MKKTLISSVTVLRKLNEPALDAVPTVAPSPCHGHGEKLAGSRNSARLLGGRERPWLQKLGLNAVKQSIMYNVYLKLMRLACLQNVF